MRAISTLLTSSVLLIVAGGGSGCIGVPLIERPMTASGHDVRCTIGDAKSDREIRTGVTTREQVLQEFGDYRWRTSREQALGYEYAVRATYWIDPFVSEIGLPFPFHRPYTPAYWFLFFEFDKSGMLRRYDLQRRFGWTSKEADDLWKSFIAKVPDQDDSTTRPAPGFSGN